MKYLWKVIFCLWLTYKIIFGKARSDVYGKACFMDRIEMNVHFAKSNQGIRLSARHRLSLPVSYQNLCLIAPTGSGKTTRYVIPNILHTHTSVVVTDPSGEIYRHTAGHLQNRGFKLQVLAPADLANSLRFNPLAFFQTTSELKQIATILGSLNSSGSDQFWITGAVQILFICLVAVKNTADEQQLHIGRVRELLNEIGKNLSGFPPRLLRKELKTKLTALDEFMHKNLDARTLVEYQAFMAQDSKVSSSILATARSAIDLWSDPDIVEFSQGNSVDIEALRQEKTIIYIIVPEYQLSYFAIIINLFYSASFDHCIRHPQGNPVFYFLDEFGNLPKIPNFASIATTLRKKRCSLSLILQDLSQLTTVYGKDEAQAIFAGGMQNKLFFAGLDLESSRYLENVLGMRTAYDFITATGKMDLLNNLRTVAKPLLPASEIRMMKPDEAILVSGSLKPSKFTMKPFYKNRKMQRWSRK